MTDPTREAFEAWYAANDNTRKSIQRDATGYRLIQTEAAWQAWDAAWQAARAQQGREVGDAAVPVEQARETLWREWGIDGMPKDKQRLADAAFKAGLAAAPTPPAVEWLPIESAPKDGTWIVVGWTLDGGASSARFVGGCFQDSYGLDWLEGPDVWTSSPQPAAPSSEGVG